MRVLFLNYEYPPLGGGAGVATRELARSLAGRGIEIDVLTTGWRRGSSTAGAARADLDRRTEVAGGDRIQVVRVPTPRRGVHDAGMSGALRYVRAAREPLRRLVRERDYDVAQLFFGLPTGLLLSAVQAAGIPAVLSLRGSDVPGYDERKPLLQALHVLLRPLTRRIWSRADRVVALSEGLGQLARRTSPGLRFDVIRNGVDPELFHPAREERAPGPIHFLSVARLIKRKNLGALLDAWSLLERGAFRLEIVGSGPEERSLRERAITLGLDDEVTFAGLVEHPQLAARYRSADIFVLAPLSESFGNVFAEAMASGLPVVASRVGGIPEFVTHGSNGLLVAPGDAGELAAALAALGEDAALRASMAEANRRKVLDELRWAVAAERYLEIYRSLIPETTLRDGSSESVAAGRSYAAR